MMTKTKLEEICNKFAKNKNDCLSFIEIYNFLLLNPEFASRVRDKKKITTSDWFEKTARKFYESKYKNFTPSTPGTVPDSMVDSILNLYYGYDLKKLKIMQIEHQHSMAAENAVGEFIELYLDSILSKHGWIRCCGQIVSKTDFIKKIGSSYKMLQVKSRDNTENSSSSSVREGTEIMKWFRYFAKTGKKNWDKFPDENAKQELSEDGFINFVKNYAKHI